MVLEAGKKKRKKKRLQIVIGSIFFWCSELNCFSYCVSEYKFSLHPILQAMEELRKFMMLKNLPNKNRQKLMRNLRVCSQ